jgi:hypothetical protein
MTEGGWACRVQEAQMASHFEVKLERNSVDDAMIMMVIQPHRD